MNGRQLVLVTISLSSDIQGDDFERFMQQTVFPAIELAPTRVGMVEGGDLYRSVESERDYIWAIWWNGVRMPATLADALETLQSRGLQISTTPYYRVSNFPAQDNP
jgi:hypothetical protein